MWPFRKNPFKKTQEVTKKLPAPKPAVTIGNLKKPAAASDESGDDSGPSVDIGDLVDSVAGIVLSGSSDNSEPDDDSTIDNAPAVDPAPSAASDTSASSYDSSSSSSSYDSGSSSSYDSSGSSSFDSGSSSFDSGSSGF